MSPPEDVNKPFLLFRTTLPEVYALFKSEEAVEPVTVAEGNEAGVARSDQRLFGEGARRGICQTLRDHLDLVLRRGPVPHSEGPPRNMASRQSGLDRPSVAVRALQRVPAREATNMIKKYVPFLAFCFLVPGTTAF